MRTIRDALLFLLTIAVLSGCVTGNRISRTTDTLSGQEAGVLAVEETSIEFGGVSAESSLPPGKSQQVEAVGSYLLSRLTDSPYYRVVLTDQERILTGSIGLIEGRYLLSLNMVNFDTTEIESSVSVDFLSLGEFDYAVDLAVARLEGREINPAVDISIPAVSFTDLGLDELKIDFRLPEIEVKATDDDLRRMSGMLTENLEQGDYHLREGRYQDAIGVYRDFIERFDHGITGAYAARLAEYRLYAEKQIQQAGLLISLGEFRKELEGVQASYSAGNAERAYKAVSSLADRIDRESDLNPDAFGQILEKVRQNQVNLYSHVVRDKLQTVEDLIGSENYSRAFFELRKIRQELERDRLQDELPDIYRVVQKSERELERTCNELMEAKTAEFLFNIGYHGFNDDRNALIGSFSGFRNFIVRSPFLHSSAVLFNRKLSYYSDVYHINSLKPIPAPAVLQSFGGYSFLLPNQGTLKAMNFPEAETRIRLIYRFGTLLMQEMSKAGFDPIEYADLIDSIYIGQAQSDPSQIEEMQRKSVPDIIKSKPDLFHANTELADFHRFYQEYRSGQNEDLRRDDPELLAWRIDREGYPLYVYHEEYWSYEGSDTAVLTLVYHTADGYRIEVIDQTDSINDLWTLLFFNDVSVDYSNNPVVSYVEDRYLRTVKFTGAGRISYPEIEYFKSGLFWKKTGNLKQRFKLLYSGLGRDNDPLVFISDKEGLSVLQYDGHLWNREALEQGDGFLYIADDSVMNQETRRLRLLFFRVIDETVSFLILKETAGGWVIEELPSFTDLRDQLYRTDCAYYFMDENSFGEGLIGNNSDRGTLLFIEKADNAWQAALAESYVDRSAVSWHEGQTVQTPDGPVMMYADIRRNSSRSIDEPYRIDLQFAYPSKSGWRGAEEIRLGIAADYKCPLLIPDGYGRIYIADEEACVKAIYSP